MSFLKLKKILRNKIPSRIKEFVSYSEDVEYGTVSFSQYGEDLVLNQLLNRKEKGFYVDIGAHHPFKFSNTYFFYKKGWTGINIDPVPGFKKLFDTYRSEDINIESGVGDEEGFFDYFFADHPAMNSFCNEKGINSDKTPIQIQRLGHLLDRYLDPGTYIDFFSIDTEGYDLKVLKSNDWEKYQPEFIVVEDKEFSYENLESCRIYNFLKSKSYKLISGSVISFIYKLS